MQSQAYITFVIFGTCLMNIKLIGPTVEATDHRLCLFFFFFLLIFSNGGAGVFIFYFGVKLVSWFLDGWGFPFTRVIYGFLFQ